MNWVMGANTSLLPPISTYISPEKRVLPPICDWPEEDRPREKLIRNGAKVMTNAELLAILINTGQDNKSAIDLANEILFSAGNSLAELAKMDVRQLMGFRGVGQAKAVTILAAMELARRKQCAAPPGKPVIRNSEDIVSLLRPLMQDQCYESFYTLYLSHANKVLHCSCISTGGFTSTTVDPRMIFQEALCLRATRLILAHNHPSGSLNASRADLRVTNRLIAAGRLLDIEILDHVIISDTGYMSFRDDGMLGQEA